MRLCLVSMTEFTKSKPARLVLNLAIDVSGTPIDDVYVGLASIATDKINRLEKSFKKSFPRIYHGKHKGAKLKANELLKVIKFLNDNNVFMFTNKISKSDWQMFKNGYLNKSYFNERIYALAYFGLVRNCAHKIHPQNLVVCKESYLDINKVLIYFQFLAKSNNFTIISTYGHANSTFLIKLADIVASTHRKVDNRNLVKFNRYFRYDIKDLDPKFIKKIFEK